ncbi:putative DNA binding domain-containing protein [Candidatus Desantisbacteria bacterium]|nr:putative DNA binding domain-containing protein [Candidatus Desantisbacteria bacterium]
MALPINIYELLHGRVVESERLEFKEGWNPEAVLHTMCAFANDINNWGGGYIVIGVAEKKNVPVFPPNGLSQSEIVKIQKELLGLFYKIRPEYFLSNHNANLNDLNITLIRSYLAEIRSAFSDEVSKVPFADLCIRMNIAQGSAEYFKPKNIGLLLFNDNPEKFFPRARIDIVEFEDEAGDVFAEKIFTGPVHQQVRSALGYLKNTVIREFVRKIPGRAEADRFYNYPYEALEEALVNAVYHKSYEEREPVEVRIYPDHILILSYPGPLPPLGKDNINKPIVTSHRYRNSRLGDFLKELHLTEGRCTGFPKIRKALKRNGSPSPVFETDDDREYFMATFKIHSQADKKHEQDVSSLSQDRPKIVPSEETIKILKASTKDKNLLELMEICGKTNRTRFRNFYIKPLIDEGLLELTIPDKPNSRLQKYKVTLKGLTLLKDEKR